MMLEAHHAQHVVETMTVNSGAKTVSAATVTRNGMTAVCILQSIYSIISKTLKKTDPLALFLIFLYISTFQKIV